MRITVSIFVFLILVCDVLTSGCFHSETQEEYQARVKREREMRHMMPPKPFENMMEDLYDKSIQTCETIWVIRKTDKNKFEPETCRRVNNDYWIMATLECEKPNHPNIKLQGTVKLYYKYNGDFIRVEPRDIKVMKTLD